MVEPEEFLSRLSTEGVMQKALEVSVKEMRLLYAEGFAHYEKREYQKAYDYFHSLVLLNPLKTHHWMAYSACLHLLGQNDKALQGYAMAAFLDKENPFPHFHAHECYLAMHEKEEAKKALQFALELCGDDPKYESLKMHCKKVEDLVNS